MVPRARSIEMILLTASTIVLQTATLKEQVPREAWIIRRKAASSAAWPSISVPSGKLCSLRIIGLRVIGVVRPLVD